MNKENTRFRSESDLVAETTVAEAEVYRKGGLVRRRAEVNVKEGENIIYLTGISKSATRDSIRLIFEDESRRESVEVLDCLPECERGELSKEEQKCLKEYKLERQKLKEELETTQMALRMMQAAAVPRPGQERTMEDTLSGIKTFQKEYAAALSKEHSLKEQLKDNKKKQKALYGQEYGHDDNKDAPCIMTRIFCTKEGNLQLTVEYWENQIAWIPAYEVEAFSKDQKLSLITRAKIAQLTGERWSNIQVKLVTGGAKDFGYKSFPDLQPKKITSHGIKDQSLFRNMKGRDLSENTLQPWSSSAEFTVGMGYGAGFPEEDDLSRSMPMPMMSSSASAGNPPMPEMSLNAKGSASSLAPEFSRKEADSSQLSEYVISSGINLESDPYGRLFDVDKLETQADYRTYVFPEFAVRGFLKAKIDPAVIKSINAASEEADVYFDRIFLGNVLINTGSVKEEGSIYLGRDDRVTSERKLIEKNSKREMFRGKNHKYYGYEITIKNRRKGPLPITIFDRIPVSSDQNITVNPIELSEGRLDKESGKVEWEKTLKADETLTLTLAYEIVE